MRCEADKVAWIQDYDCFHIKRKDSDEEEFKTSAYDLLPNDSDTYGVAEVSKYHHKLICEFISDGNFDLFDRLYNDTLISEVWDYLAIRKAVTNT